MSKYRDASRPVMSFRPLLLSYRKPLILLIVLSVLQITLGPIVYKQMANARLFSGIDRGSVVEVERALAMGAEVNRLTGHVERGTGFAERFRIATGQPSESIHYDTPFTRACHRGTYEVLAFLIVHGGNWRITDAGGNNGLSWAASNPDTSVVDLLIRHGADVNLKNGNGATPLVVATTHTRYSTMSRLIAAGANPDISDDDGLTAIDYATRAHDTTGIQILHNCVDLRRRLPHNLGESP